MLLRKNLPDALHRLRSTAEHLRQRNKILLILTYEIYTFRIDHGPSAQRLCSAHK